MLKIYSKKIHYISLIISYGFMLGSYLLHASSNNTNEFKEVDSIKPVLFIEEKDFILKDLRPSDSAIKDIVYNTEGTFPSASCELTKICSTPCYEGKGKREAAYLPTKYEQIPIPAISVEEGIAKIIQHSSDSQDQKNLIENLDRRHQIKWPDMQGWPYRIHGHLIMKYGHDTYTGSGVLVGPHHVLTAAHNIYNRNGQWAQEVLFAPGRYQDKYPYGDCKGCLLLVPQKWSDNKLKDKERESYDFGMVILDTAIGNITGWSGLLSLPKELLTEWPVTVTGYPGDKGTGNYHSTQMWEMHGDMKRVTDHQLYYDIDTWEGQSGSAVWRQEWPEYKGPYTVGVHTYREDKDGEGNKGTRLTKDKFDLILYWLQAYQLPNVLSIPLPSQQHPLPTTEPHFFDEVPEHYKSRVLRAKAGVEAAIYEIGKLYLEGFESTPGDNSKAYAFFYKAAEKGYGPALTALGAWYEQQDKQQHLLKAIHLYQMAKGKKDTEAIRRLALLYLEGKGLPKRVETAIKLLKEAADKGDGKAYYHLAKLCEEEKHVTQNKEYATKIYEQAQKLGYNIPARVHLKLKPSRLWQPIAKDTPLYYLPSSPQHFIESAPKGINKSYLTLIWEALHKNPIEAVSELTSQISIVGMGGLGKTTLALQYAYEALKEKAYDFIYWIDSETKESFLKGYQGILKKLKYPLLGGESLEEVIENVQQELSNRKRWLLIYDNVHDPSFLHNKIPQLNGHVLITSRCSEGWFSLPIHLDVLQEEDAVEYLFKESLHLKTEVNEQSARQIAKELGYLPLALSHAKAYMETIQKLGVMLLKLS
jgi:V8-like Glu-specific endopeptidase